MRPFVEILWPLVAVRRRRAHAVMHMQQAVRLQERADPARATDARRRKAVPVFDLQPALRLQAHPHRAPEPALRHAPVRLPAVRQTIRRTVGTASRLVSTTP